MAEMGQTAKDAPQPCGGEKLRVDWMLVWDQLMDLGFHDCGLTCDACDRCERPPRRPPREQFLEDDSGFRLPVGQVTPKRQGMG